MTDDVVRPVPVPAGIGSAGRRLWRSIAAQWASDGLEPDARERDWLAAACRERDLLASIDAALDAAVEAGELTVKGSRGQMVAHPLFAEARSARSFITATLNRLGFDDAAGVPDSGAGLPSARPMTVAEAGRKGGTARARRMAR